jgi:hypothetical protein
MPDTKEPGKLKEALKDIPSWVWLGAAVAGAGLFLLTRNSGTAANVPLPVAVTPPDTGTGGSTPSAPSSPSQPVAPQQPAAPAFDPTTLQNQINTLAAQLNANGSAGGGVNQPPPPPPSNLAQIGPIQSPIAPPSSPYGVGAGLSRTGPILNAPVPGNTARTGPIMTPITPQQQLVAQFNSFNQAGAVSSMQAGVPDTTLSASQLIALSNAGQAPTLTYANGTVSTEAPNTPAPPNQNPQGVKGTQKLS